MSTIKRDSDRMDDGERPAKRYKGPPVPQKINVKILVPQDATGKILGKKGDTIIQLQKDHDVSMQLSGYQCHYPGTDDRVLLVAGKDVDSVNKVLDFVLEKLFETLNKEDIKVKLAIANSTVGVIMGKKGAEIKKLREDHNINWVAFTSKQESIVPHERILTFVGKQENIFGAMCDVVSKIEEDKNNGNNISIKYTDDYQRDERSHSREFSSGRDRFSDRRGDSFRGTTDNFQTRSRGVESRPSPFSSEASPFSMGRQSSSFDNRLTNAGSSNSLLDSLGLDMKISIPTQGTGKPLSSSVICQLVEHVEDKLKRTAYDAGEFKSICTSIANLASLGLLELGLTSHNNDGFKNGADDFRGPRF